MGAVGNLRPFLVSLAVKLRAGLDFIETTAGDHAVLGHGPDGDVDATVVVDDIDGHARLPSDFGSAPLSSLRRTFLKSPRLEVLDQRCVDELGDVGTAMARAALNPLPPFQTTADRESRWLGTARFLRRLAGP